MTTKIKAKTASGAAEEILRTIRRMPGGDDARVVDSIYVSGGKSVVWESGPYDWALAATGGDDIWWPEYGGELRSAGIHPDPTFDFSGGDWDVECENSYTLVVVGAGDENY